MGDGSAAEAAIIGREGACGVVAGLGLWRAFARAVVQVPGAALRISVAQFTFALERSASVRRIALSYTGFLMVCFQQAAACNGMHYLERRLCRCIIQAHDRAEGDELALTQEFLAQMLGVRRTSINFIARLLQHQEMISVGRGVIKILDREALERRACECYATLTREFGKTFG